MALRPATAAIGPHGKPISMRSARWVFCDDGGKDIETPSSLRGVSIIARRSTLDQAVTTRIDGAP